MDTIYKLFDAFIFKWQQRLEFHISPLWAQFIQQNNDACKKIHEDIRGWDINIKKRHGSIKLGSKFMIDIAVCNCYLYPTDKVVCVRYIDNEDSYVIISKYGTVMQKKDYQDMQILEYGALPYSLVCVQLIHQFHGNHIDDWVKFIQEMNDIVKMYYISQKNE